MKEEKIYVGEYSNIQNCYHICTLDESVKINLDMAREKFFNGYIPLCYGYSWQEVREKLEKIEAEIGRP